MLSKERKNIMNNTNNNVNSTFAKTQKKVIIAEKPSVAQSIAKVIGADKREDGYLEGNGYIVSWCVGHLVELASPDRHSKDRKALESLVCYETF